MEEKMVDRKKLENQFDRFAPAFLKKLQDKDPETMGGNVLEFAATAQALGAFALYESSKRIEYFSKWLTVLTVALVFLTFVLAARIFVPWTKCWSESIHVPTVNR